MSRLKRFVDPSLHAAWWRFKRLWRPMALWTFLTWVLLGLILVPSTVALSKWVVFRGERAILGNEDLIAWMAEPEGLAYLVVVAVLSTIGIVIRFAGLFRMVTDDMTGRPVNVVRTFGALFLDFPALVFLCFVTVGAALLLVIPLLGGLAAIYTIWLTDYDINYYLSVGPSEWTRARLVGIIWTIFWSLGAIYVVLRGALAFPAYLDGHRPARVAFKQSWRTTQGGALRVLRIFVGFALVWILLRTVLQAVFFEIAAAIAENAASVVASLTPILLISSGYATGTVLLDALLSFVGFSVVSIVLTKIYYEDTHLHIALREAPIERVPLSKELSATIRKWLRPARALPALILIILVSTLAADRLSGGIQRDDSLLVIAHRAGTVLAVENTLAALERSIEAGADFVEIDVQTTRDSIVVVFHDADLMRLASDPRQVAATNYEDLASMDFGCIDADPGDCHIATLEEFVRRAKGRIGLSIELKYYGSNSMLAELVVELVRRHNMTARNEMMIMSMQIEAVHQVRRLDPDIRTGYLAAVSVGNLTQLPIDYIAVERRTASERLLRSARRNGVDVYVWTVNDAGNLIDLIRLGVNGVITDDPERIVRMLEGLADLSSVERLLLSFQPLMLDDGAE